MFVDFVFKRAPRFRVACMRHKGRWKKDILRTEFRELVAWAKKNRLRTGKWIFAEHGDRGWEACLEIAGAARPAGRVKVRTLPSATVASVVFNPEEVSPRVVYHGLNDWLRWRRKDGDIKSVGASREVYDGDPWSNARAWANCNVQYVVRK